MNMCIRLFHLTGTQLPKTQKNEKKRNKDEKDEFYVFGNFFKNVPFRFI